jgi:hypothetical protein
VEGGKSPGRGVYGVAGTTETEEAAEGRVSGTITHREWFGKNKCSLGESKLSLTSDTGFFREDNGADE